MRFALRLCAAVGLLLSTSTTTLAQSDSSIAVGGQLTIRDPTMGRAHGGTDVGLLWRVGHDRQRLTLAQRAVLRAVVLEDGRGMHSADVRARHRLGGPSTVQTSLAALVRDDLIAREGDRFAVVDSLMREWVARRTF